jgi:hypothetical protein
MFERAENQQLARLVWQAGFVAKRLKMLENFAI